jgi:hypothetical protein
VLSTRWGPSTISRSIFNFPTLSLQSSHSFHILQSSSLSLYYFNVFRRALTSLRTASTKKNEISSREASIMDECIANFTNQILELEDQRKNLRQYLYIGGLKIKSHLLPPAYDKSRQLSSSPSYPSALTKLCGDVDFVRTSVEELLKSCTHNSPSREIPQGNRSDSITQCPSSIIERPERFAADRTISPRTSHNRNDLWILTAPTLDRKV